MRMGQGSDLCMSTQRSWTFCSKGEHVPSAMCVQKKSCQGEACTHVWLAMAFKSTRAGRECTRECFQGTAS